MSIFYKIFSKLSHESRQDSYNFCYDNAKSGLIFKFKSNKNIYSCEESLFAYRYIILQQLLESGDAKYIEDGIFVENEVLCRLDDNSRQFLTLPEAWPGSFELDIKGNSSQNTFSLSLIPHSLYGNRKYKPRRLDGPFLVIDNKKYLPTQYQWLALHAVEMHSDLPLDKRTEIENLKVIKLLQEACNAGANIEIRRFSSFNIEEVDKVGVSVVENQDGSIRLIPKIGSDLSPFEIENCVWQIENKNNDSVLRIKKKLILLDEKRIKAVHEILSNRLISATEKNQFFQTPGAYLNASLVDLDTGFSFRVHGAEVFKKAYFGQIDSSGINWFDGDNIELNDSFTLSMCKDLINSTDEFELFEQLVEDSIENNKEKFYFKGKEILLGDKTFAYDVLNSIYSHICEIEDDNENKKHKNDKLTVKIDLNDDFISENIKNESYKNVFYDGLIIKDNISYKIFDYQEEGIRWILGLMNFLLNKNSSECCGGLLADDMGLGKTFMILASLNTYRKKVNSSNLDKPILAVMPVVLLENWNNEIQKCFKKSPFLDIVILQKDAQLYKYRQDNAGREIYNINSNASHTQTNIRYSLKIGSKFGINRLDMPGRLVLTNYDTLRDYQFSLCMVDWGCVIFDESQEIKNSNTLKSRAAKGLKADFRLAVTGTPIENSLSDFWSLYDTVKPGLLGTYQDFRKKYISPIRDAVDEQNEELKKSLGIELRELVGNYMLRRTKLEINQKFNKDFILPKKIIHDGIEDKKYSNIMSGFQLDVYESIISSVIQAKNSGNIVKYRKIFLPSLQKLKNVSLHPFLLTRDTPPECKSLGDVNKIIKDSAKLTILFNIIDEIKSRNEKCIIFVINKNLQRFLAYAIGLMYGLCVYIINGETKSVSRHNEFSNISRMGLIKKFEDKEGFNVICMSPLAAGVGLTVVGANNVVHLERCWNPAKESQATDRVYRIGAKKDVHVYIPILYHPDKLSFDENLDILLKKKIDIKDSIMEVNNIGVHDFDFNNMFGDKILCTSISTEWIGKFDDEHLIAISIIIARNIFQGKAYLVEKNKYRICGVIKGSLNIILYNFYNLEYNKINIAEDVNAFADIYSKNNNINIDKKVVLCSEKYDKADLNCLKNSNIEIWSRSYIDKMLKQYKIMYYDIDNLLVESRLKI